MRPFALVAVWLGVLGAMIWWYLTAEGPQLSGRRVGQAVTVAGRVEYRLEQIALWSDVRRGQPLLEGSIVSTGKDARAEVRLETGKLLELGSETQVILSSNSVASRSDFVVNVVVGKLKVKNDGPPAPSAPFVGNIASIGLRAIGRGAVTQIRLGGKVIDVPDAPTTDASDAVPDKGANVLDLTKSEDGKVEVKTAAGASVTVRDELSGHSVAVSGVWRPSPAPEPEAEAAPEAAPELPKVDPDWAEAKLAEDVLAKATLPDEWSKNLLWHPASLRAGRAEPLSLEFTLPPGKGGTLVDKRLLARFKARGAPLTKQGDVDGDLLKFTLAGEDFRALLAGASSGDPGGKGRGIHALTVELGVQAERDPQWAHRTHAILLGSATDFALPRMRVLLSESTWNAAYRAFEDGRPQPTPRWFWQGARSSALMRDGSRMGGPSWKVSLDFADPLAGPRFVALLRNGGEFALEAAPAAPPPDRPALRFVRGNETRLVLLALEEDLVREAGRRGVDGLLAWTGATLAYLGREGQALDKGTFLERLREAASGGARDWDWKSRGKGFGVVFPGRDKPVFVEWDVATRHPGFTRAFLGKAEAFVPVDAPKSLRVRRSDADAGTASPEGGGDAP